MRINDGREYALLGGYGSAVTLAVVTGGVRGQPEGPFWRWAVARSPRRGSWQSLQAWAPEGRSCRLMGREKTWLAREPDASPAV